MRKTFYIVAALWVVSLFSCTTAQYGNTQTASIKNKKIAVLKYEMARNIVLHKDYTNLANAFRYLNEAEKVLPNDPKIYYIKALAYQLRGNKKEYVIFLNKAIAKDKSFFDAYNALGIYDYEEGFYNRAIDMFTRLIKNPLYSHPDIAFFNRSRVYIKLREYAKAENDIESALMFSNYKSRIYWKSLIALRIRQKHYLQALTSLYQMENNTGSSYYTFYMKALCYERLSMYGKAKEELNKIKNDDPEYSVLKMKLLQKINADNSNN